MISEIIKSAVVLAVAACIVAALRRRSAALRHAVWTAGLLAALTVPICSLLLPTWNTEFAGQAAAVLEKAVQTGGLLPAEIGGISGVISSEGAVPEMWSLGDYALALWLSGTALGFLILLAGAARLAWIAVGSEPLADERWAAIAEEVRRAHGIRRPVRLLQNGSVPFLGTWGIMAPRVLVPANAGAWSDERIRMVLGHELAHIKRHDWMVQVLAEAARAIYWFNPMFWLVCSRLRRESEHACDDAVIRMGTAGTHYAEELLDLTRTLRGRHHLQSPILAMAQPSHLERRLVALLNPSLNRLAATPWAVIVVVLAAIGLTLPLAAIRARQDEVVPAPSLVTTRQEAAPPVAAPSPTAAPDPVTIRSASVPPASKTDEPAVESLTSVAVVQPGIPAGPAVPADASPSVSLAPSPLRQEPTADPAVVLSTANVTADSEALEPTIASKASIAAVQPEIPDVPRVAAAEPAPYECKVTPSVRTTRTETMKSSSFGDGPWHISEDRVLWVWDQPYVAGREVNTIWMRPVNAEIAITGRRMDADAPRLEARARSSYSSGYVATGLVFPAPGCWEITATSNGSRLTFVTSVKSR